MEAWQILEPAMNTDASTEANSSAQNLIAAREESLRQEMATKMDDVTDLPHQKVVMRRRIAQAKMTMGYADDEDMI